MGQFPQHEAVMNVYGSYSKPTLSYEERLLAEKAVADLRNQYGKSAMSHLAGLVVEDSPLADILKQDAMKQAW